MMHERARWQGGGGNKKRFQYCTDSSGQEILYLRTLQGRSGRNPIDPLLKDNVLIPNNFLKYIYHVGCAVNLHSITNSGLIPGGQKLSGKRQTVFFTAVNPMHKNHHDPKEFDLTKPRLASCKQKWKVHQDTVYWADKQLAQRKIGRVILDSDVASRSKDIQRIDLKPNTNYQEQGDLLQDGKKNLWNVPSLIATLLIKRNMIMSEIQRVR